MIDNFPYGSEHHALAPGDLVCLMTDGVVEAMNRTGDLYGRARLERVLGACGAGASPTAVCDAIRADVARFTDGAEPADDVGILAVRWNGPAGARLT